eukprot:CFRG6625T1
MLVSVKYLTVSTYIGILALALGIYRMGFMNRRWAAQQISSPSPWRSITYECNRSAWQKDIDDLYMPMELDAATRDWIEWCESETASLFSTFIKPIAIAFLRPFMSRTSVNGATYRGSMHVLSHDQFKVLLNSDSSTPSQTLEGDGSWENSLSGRNVHTSLLDIGAGDGAVTAKLAPIFDHVVATEVSPVMVWRLGRMGFENIQTDTLSHPKLSGRTFDVVSLLNVLDRCHDPLGLLRDIKKYLKPVTGRLLVAVVLPFKPIVEEGTKWVRPKQAIPPTARATQPTCCNSSGNSNWEAWVPWLVYNYFVPSGFKVERFTRTPYLCSGDSIQPFYVIHDAVFVLSVPEEEPPTFIDLGNDEHIPFDDVS